MIKMLVRAARQLDDGRHARTGAGRAVLRVVHWLWTGATGDPGATAHPDGRHHVKVGRTGGRVLATEIVTAVQTERITAVMDAVFPTARERFTARLAQADRAADSVRRTARQVVTHVATATGPVRHRMTQHMSPAQQWARGRFDAALALKRRRDREQYSRKAFGEMGTLASMRVDNGREFA